MKNLQLAHFIIFFSLLSFSSLCQEKIFTGFKTLTTQADVDAFGADNYTQIEGWLRIEGDDITNLNALESLNYISSSLYIYNNPNIEDLSGLKNLDTLGRSVNLSSRLYIHNNSKLKNLEGLESLEKVDDIQITNNENLVNIDGLKNVTSDLDQIKISKNKILNSLLGLQSITKVKSYLYIQANDNLLSLNGLEKITNIGGTLTIQENISLTNLNPLSNLEIAGSLWITLNEKLDNFCGLSKLFQSNLSSSFSMNTAMNLYNPNIDDIKNGNCSDSINFSLEYPKENDVYIVGRKIRLQFPEDVGIPTDSEINLSYSFDKGGTWIDENTTVFDNDLGTFLTTPNVTQPREISIKINTLNDGNDISFIREKITIQPVNYYEDLGFREDGVSEIDFPLEGFKGSDRGWVDIKGSRGHFCLDNSAVDFNYLNYYDKTDITCGKIIRAPFDGKIISIDKGENYNKTLLCGGTTNEQQQYVGLHVTIQSKHNKNFATLFGHLKNVNDSLFLGKNITKGSFIGNIGGSGTEGAHLHMANYKNLYDWTPLSNINSIKTNTILEKISIGDTFFEKDNVELCNKLEDNSANVNFNYTSDNNFHFTSIAVETHAEFIGILSSLKNYFLSDFRINFLSNKSISKKTDVDNFELMKNVKSIDGSLEISNTNLVNLNDFQNITSIGGDLIISNNKSLSNYCGILDILKNKGLRGDLIIEGNNENPDLNEILNYSECSKSLSIIDNENEVVVVYPNPVKKEIFIKGIKNYSEIVIYDANGKKMNFFKKNKFKIDMLSKGLYFLKIKTSNKIFVRKFIKE